MPARERGKTWKAEDANLLRNCLTPLEKERSADCFDQFGVRETSRNATCKQESHGAPGRRESL
jgi:hypothetical protein